MKYVQPIGGAADDPYVDANPSGGIEGSAVPAAAIEHPMRELAALISDAGLAPTDADLTQVAKAIKTIFQKSASISAAASGTVNAITANYTPAITALADHMLLIVRASGANTSTTPTFTPASATIAAKTIVKGHNQALVAGDISGAGFRMELQYDLTLDKWVLLNPANGVNVVTVKQLQTVGATVAANAMTVTLNPTSLDFRSTTQNSGTINTRTVAAQLSLTIPSTATLGTVSGVASRILLLAIDNAGTVELAVYNAAGAANLDETGVISTTAIAAASNSLTVYSQTARTNVPYRIVGYVDSTQATAGTWATAPSSVQGIGGQALATMSSLGYGQAWQNLTGSRVLGTTYYNTSGRPIIICVSGTYAAGGYSVWVVNGLSGISHHSNAGSVPESNSSIVVIPVGASYSISSSALSSINWFELR